MERVNIKRKISHMTEVRMLTMLGKVLFAIGLIQVDKQEFLASSAVDLFAQFAVVGHRDALLLLFTDRRLQSINRVLDGGQICFSLNLTKVLEARRCLQFALAQILDREASLDEHDGQCVLIRLRLHQGNELIAVELAESWQEAWPTSGSEGSTTINKDFSLSQSCD
jgi:hypothetical protein